MAVGLDSAKEETDAYERPYLDRGIATLVFDGPGQGEGEYDFAIRGDYEVAVKAVVDYVMTRRDLDTARIGLWGVSLGGYYAPRAAAFEKRIKACLALGGPYDWQEAWGGLAGADARSVPRAQPLRHAGRGEPPRLEPVAQGRGAEHHLSDLRDDRQARPPDPVAARRAAGAAR